MDNVNCDDIYDSMTHACEFIDSLADDSAIVKTECVRKIISDVMHKTTTMLSDSIRRLKVTMPGQSASDSSSQQLKTSVKTSTKSKKE